ncbi:MAG: hypothetical protein WA961_11065, partial [Rhodanobacter sp.]
MKSVRAWRAWFDVVAAGGAATRDARRRCHNHQASRLSSHSAMLPSAIQRHGVASAGAACGVAAVATEAAGAGFDAGGAALPPIAG